MIAAALRSLWNEPRAANPPERSWLDWLLVGAVMVTALLEGIFRADVPYRLMATVVAVGLAPVLLFRRSHPLASVVAGFGTAMALALASLQEGMPPLGLNSMFYVILLVYALVRWGSGREIVLGAVVILLAWAIGTLADANGLPDVIGGFAVLAAVAAGAAASRYRADNHRRALEQVRNTERVSLARELHDTVAHHVSAITVQAQAGRAMASQRPESAVEALTAIEDEATRTLAEMRTMVRVLRDGAAADYAPQSGLADLKNLARQHPSPVVKVEVSGDLAAIRPQVEAALFRIAQEALTNALRHARYASRVDIDVIEEGAMVRLSVTDDGETASGRTPVPGFGLTGMTERAQLLGGALRAGPKAGGGWAVEAELPTEVPR